MSDLTHLFIDLVKLSKNIGSFPSKNVSLPSHNCDQLSFFASLKQDAVELSRLQFLNHLVQILQQQGVVTSALSLLLSSSLSVIRFCNLWQAFSCCALLGGFVGRGG